MAFVNCSTFVLMQGPLGVRGAPGTDGVIGPKARKKNGEFRLCFSELSCRKLGTAGRSWTTRIERNERNHCRLIQIFDLLIFQCFFD